MTGDDGRRLGQDPLGQVRRVVDQDGGRRLRLYPGATWRARSPESPHPADLPRSRRALVQADRPDPGQDHRANAALDQDDCLVFSVHRSTFDGLRETRVVRCVLAVVWVDREGDRVRIRGGRDAARWAGGVGLARGPGGRRQRQRSCASCCPWPTRSIRRACSGWWRKLPAFRARHPCLRSTHGSRHDDHRADSCRGGPAALAVDLAAYLAATGWTVQGDGFTTCWTRTVGNEECFQIVLPDDRSVADARQRMIEAVQGCRLHAGHDLRGGALRHRGRRCRHRPGAYQPVNADRRGAA